MGTCLNVLNDPEHFLLAATLIALVLLVRTQLYASGRGRRQDENINGVMGLVWIYSALFFALVAVALLFFKVNCAKGFLILSFLMTLGDILISLLLIAVKTFKGLSLGESLTGVCINEPFRKKLPWILFWVFLLAGLVFISFSPSLLGVRFCWSLLWSWQFIIGVVLVLAAVAKAICLLVRERRRRRRVYGD